MADFDGEEKTWSGPKKSSIYNLDASVGQILFTSLQKSPNNIIQISDYDGAHLTNRQVLLLSKNIALQFIKMGLSSTDVAGIASNGSTYVLPVLYGCLFACIPFQVVNPVLEGKNFEDTQPRVVFCDKQFVAMIKSVCSRCTLVTFDEIEDWLETANENEEHFIPKGTSNGGELCAIISSSGTTGIPKAICRSHSSFSIDFDRLSSTSEDVILLVLPIFSISSLASFMEIAMTGATLVITDKGGRIQPQEILELLQKYKITKATLTPRHIAPLLALDDLRPHHFESLNRLISPGGRLSTNLRKQMRQLLRQDCQFLVGYGISELGRQCCGRITDTPNSAGVPHHNIQVRILSESGDRFGPDREGEIFIKPAVPWLGYWGNPQATESVYKDGWFSTGDLGYFDQSGILHVIGRIRHFIKSKGYRIHPSDLEDLIQGLNEVKEACVVPISDGLNSLAALVVRSSPISEDAIIDFIESKTPFYLHLTGGVFFVNELPRSLTTKLKRHEASVIADRLFAERSVKSKSIKYRG